MVHVFEKADRIIIFTTYLGNFASKSPLLLLHNCCMEKVSYPEDYGSKWLSSPSLYEAVTTLLPPASESIIHLTICGCKAGCRIQRCKCKKNGLKCSEMCKCQKTLNLLVKMLCWKRRRLNKLNKD